ncbi:MAG: hypothetical protein HY286_00300 [Planctomycetes bacterium]|nr:hypothetical protein [Planctomycetota bacterium]
MIARHSLQIIILIFAAAVCRQDGGKGGTAKSDDLGPQEFKKLFDKIIPKAQERWQKIPWRIDLLEAREVSYQSKKPIFLWAMNGHPLGCT